MDEAGQHVIDATAKVVFAASCEAKTNMSQKNCLLASCGDTAAKQLDAFDPSDMRVGADVTAKIACGKRSVLRSWFSDVFDFAHRNVLFYF